MVKVKEDLTGKKFGKLTVIKQTEDYISKGKSKWKDAQWLCKCDCGNENLIVVTGHHLKTGHTRSCGCLQKEITSQVHLKENEYDLSGDYAIGYTLNGEEFWIDKEDVDLCSKYCWCYNKKGYLVANDKEIGKVILLHRLLMGYPNSELYDVDHKKHPPRNEHKIDNRKQNLRVITKSQNCQNTGIRENNTSGVTGVSWDKNNLKWCAAIQINGKGIFLGRFANKNDAIKSRKEAELKYFGEYRYDANNEEDY